MPLFTPGIIPKYLKIAENEIQIAGKWWKPQITRRLILIRTFYHIVCIAIPKYWIKSVIDAPSYPRNYPKILEIYRKWDTNSRKMMKTADDKTFDTDWNILQYGAYNNTEILDHQCDKCSFLPPELAQNTRNMQKVIYK